MSGSRSVAPLRWQTIAQSRMDSSMQPAHVRKQQSTAQVAIGWCPTPYHIQCAIIFILYITKGHGTRMPHSHLNMMPVVAANTLEPSGDQVTKDTPPPPTRLKVTNFSMATSHTYMAVSAAEAVSSTSPCGFQVTLVTGE
ncbi:hypothetical protein L798_07046 [Zootermopsis nevadensis]|uniref:Uncharacterized protein n=1 Tax=Zootermopsis nevadensis TaxID=136037 RepID=A0A067R974_ZOONE|nr:hypothetical protein L798_07046 [Zootermopsis nevadensis]